MVRTASTWQEAEENIVSCTAQILNQAIEILRSGAIDDASYTFSSRVIAGSTPGKHFRHVLDHLRILLDSIEAWQTRASGVLRVDYDSRISSKVAHIETSAAASLREFERTNSRLHRIFEASKGELYTQPLRLCATTPFVVEMDSTVGRELWFCGLHAIHHYALARVMLVQERGLEGIDEQFGVAPSTLVHREWRRESIRAEPAEDALQVPATTATPTQRHRQASADQRQHSSPRHASLRSKL